MEVKVIDETPEAFQVKTLAIKITSQEELDFLNALFEWCPVWMVMRNYASAAAGQISSTLTRSGGVNNSTSAGIHQQLQDAVEK